MANTTNFGWETPDDTDLVKDGAAAMRTLGNAIDTSFVDLKGGTTGQVLSKASNTDLDFTWTTPAGGFVGCSAYKQTTAQSIANNTEAVITYNAEEFDTDGFHSTTTNTSRFTIPSGKGGKYLIVATGTTAAGSGIRQMNILKNGTAINRILTSAVASFETQMLISCIVDLAVADYVELSIYQNSGGSLNAEAGQAIQRFTLQFLGA